MNAELETIPQVRGGVSLLSRGGCVIRYLARSASEMTRMNKKLWDAARELVVQLPLFDHRKEVLIQHPLSTRSAVARLLRGVLDF
jgi:hypothetical protein